MGRIFERFSRFLAKQSGSPAAFVLALTLVVVWAMCGPFFHYSVQWNLAINSSTTIITFLMVFLIQAAQNTDTHAIQIKLDELIASSNANNRYIHAEQGSIKELEELEESIQEEVDEAVQKL